ncbi:hypothetical protein QUF76_11885, partial [Desulfobacterales bacterium HSG16]|nr:hypothetical protein [Desulfobacterales bacterium HSG16]
MPWEAEGFSQAVAIYWAVSSQAAAGLYQMPVCALGSGRLQPDRGNVSGGEQPATAGLYQMSVCAL